MNADTAPFAPFPVDDVILQLWFSHGASFQLFESTSISLEVVSKPPLRLNLGVGARDSILNIRHVFLRLNPPPRLDLKPD